MPQRSTALESATFCNDEDVRGIQTDLLDNEALLLVRSSTGFSWLGYSLAFIGGCVVDATHCDVRHDEGSDE